MINVDIYCKMTEQTPKGFAVAGFSEKIINEGQYILIEPYRIFHGYKITYSGEFYSRKGSLLKLEKRKRKSSKFFDWVVYLYINKKRKKFTCSRLILESFKGPGYGLEAEHINNDPSDIHGSNLRWGTRSENMKNMWRDKKSGKRS